MKALFSPQLLIHLFIRFIRMRKYRVFAKKLEKCPIICDADIVSVQESSTLKIEVAFRYNDEEMSGHFVALSPKEPYRPGQKLKLDIKFLFPNEQLIVCDILAAA